MSPAAPGPLRVAVRQTAPRRLDRDGNRASLEAAVREEPGADVVAFPELSLTGYDLGHRAAELALPLDGEGPLELPPDGPAALYGLVERGSDHLVYNVGVVQRGPRVVHVQRKRYLPTYGMFDEGRVFAPGRRGVRLFEPAPGWRAALLVCEDLWHPALTYLAALQGADVVFAPAAAGGRGDPGAAGALFGSTATWELVARSLAVVHAVWVVLVNRVGVEGPVTFAGGSLVVSPAGQVVARAPEAEEARLEVSLDREAVAEARRPYAHLRDEDPAYVSDELARIRRERL